MSDSDELFYISKSDLKSSNWKVVFKQLNSANNVSKFIKALSGRFKLKPKDLDSLLKESANFCDNGIGLNERGKIVVF